MKRLHYAIQRWALAPSVSSASALHRTMLTVCSHLSVIASLQVATYLRHNASEAGCVCVCVCALWHMSWSVSLVLDLSSSTTEHCTCEWKGQHNFGQVYSLVSHSVCVCTSTLLQGFKPQEYCSAVWCGLLYSSLLHGHRAASQWRPQIVSSCLSRSHQINCVSQVCY